MLNQAKQAEAALLADLDREEKEQQLQGEKGKNKKTKKKRNLKKKKGQGDRPQRCSSNSSWATKLDNRPWRSS